MPPPPKPRTAPRRTRRPAPDTPRSDPAAVAEVLDWLERHGSAKNREGMARYAIRSEKVFGISVTTLRAYAKTLGRSHALAAALWETGSLEARMLACFVDDPAEVTAAQLDRWARDFDNWALCDTACMSLFDRTPHAWRKIEQWSARNDTFVKRAAFALLASTSVHDKKASDAPFLEALALIERGAADERNFVKKAVSWALRSIGKRNAALNAAAVALSRRLAASESAPERWVGKDALRELTSAAVQRRLAAHR